MISVQLDPRRFNRWLNDAAQKQVPFAAARALTAAAKVGQTKLRSDMQSAMTIRRPWALKGIQVKAAQKRDGLNNMQAEVGSKDWFMADQLADQSSTRRAPGGKKQFLPYAARKGGKAAMVPKALRPAPVTAKAKTDGSKIFFKQGTGGRSQIFQQSGRGKNTRLKLLYTVGNLQTVVPKVHLSDSIRGAVSGMIEREFVKQMQAAIRSGR